VDIDRQFDQATLSLVQAFAAALPKLSFSPSCRCKDRPNRQAIPALNHTVIGFFSNACVNRRNPPVISTTLQLSASLRKDFSFFFSEIMLISAHPASSKRGVRVVTNVEAGCDGRVDAG
jgi:hypothetical protein